MTLIPSPSNSKADQLDFLNPVIIDEGWRSRTGKGVSVAIIDSGIDGEHPALQGKVYESVEAKNDNKRVLFVPSDSGDSADRICCEQGFVSCPRIPGADFHPQP